jgi:tRNA(Ile)-lysidine synthase
MAKSASRSVLLDKLCQSWPLHGWADYRQLVAVSGGADSVALLRALVELSPHRDRLIVAHFNHGWRGAESDRDERFVQDLCGSLGIELRIGRASTDNFSDACLPRSEESARRLRYEFLTRCAYDAGARYVLTAHTASDRIETLLHNLFRGTGLSGVCKPALLRPLAEELVLVRPLIACFREKIEDYLTEIGQSYCQDSSNSDEAYRRNFLRQSLLPLLRQTYGGSVDQNLLSFSAAVEETVETLDQMAQHYWRKVDELASKSIDSEDEASIDGQSIRFPTSTVLPEHWPVVRHALQAAWSARGWPRKGLNRSHWQSIERFWSGNSPVSSKPTSSDVWNSQEEEEEEEVGNEKSHDTTPKDLRPVHLAGGVRVSLNASWVVFHRQPDSGILAE